MLLACLVKGGGMPPDGSKGPPHEVPSLLRPLAKRLTDASWRGSGKRRSFFFDFYWEGRLGFVEGHCLLSTSINRH